MDERKAVGGVGVQHKALVALGEVAAEPLEEAVVAPVPVEELLPYLLQAPAGCPLQLIGDRNGPGGRLQIVHM